MSEKKEKGKRPLQHLDLVEACRRGEEKAQFELYRLYYRAMYNSAYRIVEDEADAEDVMQEAFLKAFAAIHTYSAKVPFGAWLKRITVNKALDLLRTRKEMLSLDRLAERGFEESSEDSGSGAAPRAGNPADPGALTDIGVLFETGASGASGGRGGLQSEAWEEEAEEEDLAQTEAERIRRTIMELPSGYRVVLSLILLEGYDHEEVSQILGISNVASRTQFHRARKKLIQLLQGQNGLS